jgi:hypothetical protein
MIIFFCFGYSIENFLKTLKEIMNFSLFQIKSSFKRNLNHVFMKKNLFFILILNFEAR